MVCFDEKFLIFEWSPVNQPLPHDYEDILGFVLLIEAL